MFRTKRPDPFAGIYEEASRREKDRRGTFLTQVVRSGGNSGLSDASNRTERTSTITSSGRSSSTSRKPASSLGEFASPFRVQEHEREAQARRLQRYPTVSANSAFNKAHPKELGYKTIDHKTKRAKDIQFPIFLRNNEARQDKLLTDVEIRERRLAHVKNSQIVHDYTEEGKRKRRVKKNSGSKDAEMPPKPLPASASTKGPLKSALKNTPKTASSSSVKAKSKSKSNDDELETLADDELGSQYTFETLPDGASYDYLLETEEVPVGATHGVVSTKPVKLVRKGEQEGLNKEREEAAEGENFSFEATSPKPEVEEATSATGASPEITKERGAKDVASEDASTKPLKDEDVQKSGLENKVEKQAGDAANEAIGKETPSGIIPDTKDNLTPEAATSEAESASKSALKKEDAKKVQEVLVSSKTPKEPTEAVEKSTRFKEDTENIPDRVIGDVTLEVAPQTGHLGTGVGAADVTKETQEPGQNDEIESSGEVIQAPELGWKELQENHEGPVEDENIPGSVVDDVHSEVSITSPPVDHTTVPHVVAFPEVEKKGIKFPLFRKKNKTRLTNPLATPQEPEVIVKTDREGFLTKAVYDKTKYENRQHAKWLAEFIESEKKKCEQTQLDYDNRLTKLKKEIERLEEVMEEMKDDANELIEIRHSELSKKFLNETQRYVERKNAIFIETKAIQEQKEKETQEVKLKHEEIQKEIDGLNSEKDTVHREYIGWTNRLADHSAHLDAKIFNLFRLQQKHSNTENEIGALKQKRDVIEQEMADYNNTHAENSRALESHANKEYLPQVHEIDNKISGLLNELTIIKQESANEKTKVSSISKKLNDEREAHDAQLKLEAEDRERRERDLLGKQREEHEASAAELKRKHEKELKRVKKDYERQLQEAKEQQEAQAPKTEASKAKASEPITSGSAAGAVAGSVGSVTDPATSGVKSANKVSTGGAADATAGNAKSAGKAATGGVKSVDKSSTGGTKSADKATTGGTKSSDKATTGGTKSASKTTTDGVNSTGTTAKHVPKSGGGIAKGGSKAADPKATSSNSRNVVNPFLNSPITKSGDTREFTGDPNKPSGIAPSVQEPETSASNVLGHEVGESKSVENKPKSGELDPVKDKVQREDRNPVEHKKKSGSGFSSPENKIRPDSLDPAGLKPKSSELGPVNEKNKFGSLQPYEDNAKPGVFPAFEKKGQSNTLDPYEDKTKPNVLVLPEVHNRFGSNPGPSVSADDIKDPSHYPSASRESSLFDYETEEEVRLL